MRKYALLVSLVVLVLILTGCTETSYVDGKEKTHEHVYGTVISKTESSCTVRGSQILKCNECDATITQEIEFLPHKITGWEIVKKPTANEYGCQQAVCVVCDQTLTRDIPILGTTSDYPLDVDTKKFYRDICDGKYDKYDGMYLRLNGKVTYISTYSDMTGYYIHGKMGQGVCCWVYSWQTKERLADIGDKVTFVGRVQNIGENHVELVSCWLDENE